MTALQLSPAPVVTLAGGARVANFSSPHPFTFDDGSILPACESDRVHSLMLSQVESERPGIAGTVDIDLRFDLTDEVKSAIDDLNGDENVDIILVPFPVLSALKDAGVPLGKARVCRVVDRTAKTISAVKFCV